MNLAGLAIKRPIFITCVVLLMLVLGTMSLKRMSVDLFPDVTFPIVFVQSVYPGASPLDMEKLVSKPIEDELGSLSGLDTMTSTNAESVSYVILKFKLGTDIKDAEQQVRQRISNIRRNLPTELEEPVIRRFDPADQAVVQFAVASQMEPADLYDLANEIIKPQFETLGGVGQVTIIGGTKREIHVFVDKNKLQDRRLPLIQVADKIKATSKDVPIGKFASGPSETVFRATGEFENLDELKKVNVNFFGSDQAVSLDTIAKIEEGVEERKSIATVMTKDENFTKRSSVFLSVFKQSGANTIGVVDAAINKVPKVNEMLKERGYKAEVKVVRDSARPIRLNVKDVTESILIGIALCVVVVFFFLGNGRSTFITAMALPNSLLGGFIIMAAMGFTVNILTLLALSLAVGLLIDDAIVVRENIFRHMEMGKTPRQAALEGTKEVSLAVIATTLVVISVFGPIAFLQGIVGQFFKQFGLTVVFTMLISLFDAFTVAPMLSSYLASHNEHGPRKGLIGRMLDSFDRFQTRLENFYESTLGWVLRRPKTVLALAFLTFVLSLVMAAFIPKTFISAQDNGEFVVSVEKPTGTSLEATEAFMLKIEEKLKADPNVELIASTVGSSSGQTEDNKGAFYVRLVPSKERKVNTTYMKEFFRKEFEPFQKEAIVQLGDVNIGGNNEKPLNLNLVGDDLEVLAAYADKLKARVEKIPGLVDVDTNFRAGKPEFHVNFNRSQSEALGVSTVTAGAELRGRVEGIVAGTYRKNGIEYDIRVRLQDSDRDLRKEFATTLVPNSNMNLIPLARIAEGEATTGFSQINRQNKARYINIGGNMGAGGSLGNIMAEIENVLQKEPEFKPPAGVSYHFFGQAEDFRELMQNMVIAMGLGILFIYLVLSSLYESFITPFTILLALPMAVSGAMFALLVTGKALDLFSMIGFVMLLGVVAKNSILLVDYAQQLVQAGTDRKSALVKAGRTRLRPILMTSFALIGGVIPIAIGLNEASAQRTSMGVAIIGGLISSTFLTLLVVPAAYEYIDDFRLWLGRLFLGLRDGGKKAPLSGSGPVAKPGPVHAHETVQVLQPGASD
jgi:hydrophobe/amphiphile efflux-1 (HAE1) family protein